MILNGARAFSGKSLYEDFFAFVAPGSYLWVTPAFSLTGRSYAAAPVASVVLLPLDDYLASTYTEKSAVGPITIWESQPDRQAHARP